MVEVAPTQGIELAFPSLSQTSDGFTTLDTSDQQPNRSTIVVT